MAVHVSLVYWGIPTGLYLCHTCMWSCLCALVSVGTALVCIPASTLTLVCFMTVILTREAGSLKWFQRTFLWCKDVENLGNIYWPCRLLSPPIPWQHESLIQCFTCKNIFSLYFSNWSIVGTNFFPVSIFCLYSAEYLLCCTELFQVISSISAWS